MIAEPYFKLIRLHKPVGSLLLWLPTAWALWLANSESPKPALIVYFILGTVLMRSAGCVFNDIADRHFDKHVKRTKIRPLTAGKISLPVAWLTLIVLVILAFIILVQLPSICFYYALAALLLTGFYPFCKRFFRAPQLILGLTFSMGIPMAYAASGVSPNLNLLLLYLLNVIWIITYDTMYAMADREDDKRLRIQSTAIYFGRYDCLIILGLQLIFHSLWLILAYQKHYSIGYYISWTLATIILVYQQILLQRASAQDYLQAFSSNVWYGLLMWLALIIR